LIPIVAAKATANKKIFFIKLVKGFYSDCKGTKNPRQDFWIMCLILLILLHQAKNWRIEAI
jgi:hypothetical protein